MKTICFFCGSASGADAVYEAEARALGALTAESGVRLVYGGARIGLMGAAANAALKAGGEVIGVIPRHLQESEVAHDGLTELHITQTMHERQMKMSELSDAFIVLPGGLGTLAEFFEIVTWKQLGLHKKPIVLYNSAGYWDPLIATIGQARSSGFVRNDDAGLFSVMGNSAEIREFYTKGYKNKG